MTSPHDPIGESLQAFVGDLLTNAEAELVHTAIGTETAVPVGAVEQEALGDAVVASASAELVAGWITTLSVDFGADSAAEVQSVPQALRALPAAALRSGARFASMSESTLSPAIERAMRDTVVVELLTQHQFDSDESSEPTSGTLLADTLEYLIELSGTRVEAHNLTHGVVITDAIANEPRLRVPYPSGLRDAKRSPLLFDGQRSVLIVDRAGRARTEFQAHRLDRLHPSSAPLQPVEREFVDSGSLVALATRQLGGIGFFLREDRSIWVFVDGRPLVIRRGEHWTAFPLWLARAIGTRIGGGAAVELIVGAALLVSVKTGGAIFAIVDETESISDIVAVKDRFDLRNDDQLDDRGDEGGGTMRPETKLHHLIDAGDLDAQTLARLAELDGATVLDRSGKLLAYGAIISSSDSEHEGARTAAAKSLSNRALVVLKVSEDGDITVFSDGAAVATLLPSSTGRG